jgi:hypothetical protein
MDLLSRFRDSKGDDEHLKPLNQMYMCHWGEQRSAGIQEAHRVAGKKVEIFPGGTYGLVRMGTREIKKIIGSNKLFIIFDRGSNEIDDFNKAEEILDNLKIKYQVIDTPTLNIMCYGLTSRGLDEFML